jgi:hypothetical protein
MPGRTIAAAASAEILTGFALAILSCIGPPTGVGA